MATALAGCGGGGGGGGGGSGLPAMNTTITGFLTPPTVTTPGIIANVRGLASSDILSRFKNGGTCTVNGQTMDFSLATTTRFFQISDIPPASFYKVVFTCQNLELRMIVPHEGSYIYNKTIDIDSTVKAWLIEKYAFTPTQIQNFEIKQNFIDSLAGKVETWLTLPGSNLTTFRNNLQGELASYTTNVPFGTLTSDLTPAVDLTGTWKGTNCVFYNWNLFGERAYKVTGNITLVLKQSGNTVTGTIAIAVTKNERLPGIDLGVPEPDHASAIVNGKISSTRFSFSVGKTEFWEFNSLTDMMRGKVSNLDSRYYLGIDSDEGAFSLQRQR